MAKYSVPSNTGKVRVAMGIGGRYAVWNGKQGKNEFRIYVRTRKQAEELAKIINEKKHGGEVEVWE
jgi:shikimate 5-dehydrogenase